jgi:hypothetical protein
MSDQQTSAPIDRGRAFPRTGTARSDTAPWAGWVAFGGTVMAVLGAFSVIQGVAAMVSPDVFITVDGTILAVDLVVWGWIHVIFGAVVGVTGVALLLGAPDWARGLAVVVTGFSLLVQLAWLPAYPIWSVISIVLDVLVLYALVVTWYDSPIDD